MADNEYDDNGSSSDESGDNDEKSPLQLQTKLTLRVHAANLPRYGIRKLLPDTYIDVTAIYPPGDGPGSSSTSSTPTSAAALRRIHCGRTEIIYKNTHPQYTTTFPLTYEYGSKSYLNIEVYRFSNSNNREPIRIGSAICDIGDILGSKQCTKTKRLPSGGVIFARLEPMQNEQDVSDAAVLESLATSITTIATAARSLPPTIRLSTFSVSGRLRLQVRARELVFGKRYRTPGAMVGLSKPTTFFEIQKRHPSASRQAWVAVYRSSPVYETVAPTFDEGEIDIFALCNGDLERPIRLGVWCHKKWSQDMLVGICETTPKVILDGKYVLNRHECSDDVHHSFGLYRSMQKPKIVGKIDILSARLVSEEEYLSTTSGNNLGVETSLCRNISNSFDNQLTPEQYPLSCQQIEPFTLLASNQSLHSAPTNSFQEFMKSGYCKLDLSVAIDFTSSNGDPRCPGTLHDQSSGSLNDYEETIVAVGGLLTPYCQSVSVYGFGAKYGGTARHIFHCGDTQSADDENAVGTVDSILKAYKSVFESDLIMSGPTIYDQVLQVAAARAKKHQSQDQDRSLASYPFRYCVLLIVTDGLPHDLREIKRKLQVYGSVPLSVVIVGLGRADLGDLHRLCQEIKQSGMRANVTFVEFRRHQLDPSSLGAAALHELPTQIIRYIEQHGISS